MTDPKPAPVVRAEREVAEQQRAAEQEAAAKEAAAKANAKDGAKDEAKPASRSPEQIRADIEATRRELGATVDALSAKLDVKTRGEAWVKDPANRPQLIAAGVALVSLLGLLVIRKVRS